MHIPEPIPEGPSFSLLWPQMLATVCAVIAACVSPSPSLAPALVGCTPLASCGAHSPATASRRAGRAGRADAADPFCHAEQQPS